MSVPVSSKKRDAHDRVMSRRDCWSITIPPMTIARLRDCERSEKGKNRYTSSSAFLAEREKSVSWSFVHGRANKPSEPPTLHLGMGCMPVDPEPPPWRPRGTSQRHATTNSRVEEREVDMVQRRVLESVRQIAER